MKKVLLVIFSIVLVFFYFFNFTRINLENSILNKDFYSVIYEDEEITDNILNLIEENLEEEQKQVVLEIIDQEFITENLEKISEVLIDFINEDANELIIDLDLTDKLIAIAEEKNIEVSEITDNIDIPEEINFQEILPAEVFNILSQNRTISNNVRTILNVAFYIFLIGFIIIFYLMYKVKGLIVFSLVTLFSSLFYILMLFIFKNINTELDLINNLIMKMYESFIKLPIIFLLISTIMFISLMIFKKYYKKR